MLCVREAGIPLKKNVRLVLGTDEECGSGDLPFYYDSEGEAPMTFTPDADFPLINLEKGRLEGDISASWEPSEGARVIRAEIGVKTNVIPEKATAEIAGIDLETLVAALSSASEDTGAFFEAEETDAETIIVTCTGRGGHAAYPAQANNALTAMLALLADLPLAGEAGEIIRALGCLFPHGDWRGSALGIAMEDALSGPLTCSADILSIREDGMSLVFDSRCPVCSNEENTHKVVRGKLAEAGFAMRDTEMVMPHYVSEDSDFVRTLLNAYETWTGQPGKAMSTGGGTYVHHLKNGVAFGCEMNGTDYHMHGADEFAIIDELLLASKIFAQSIIDLCS